jgi:hypothetical protein
MAGYPKELNHPDGAKTLLAYDAAEEQALHKKFAEWRLAHAEANAAAFEGREVKPASGTLNLQKRS